MRGTVVNGTASPSTRRAVAPAFAELWATAIGHAQRNDPVRRRTGGPAGNARLTAWTGIVLLPLFLAEVATLVSVRQLISWHIVIGTLLVPPALLKTASTGWRITRYYTGHRPYVEAGPPPILLRLLGPLVVVTTLALLGTGLALIALGPSSRHASLLAVAGQQVSVLTLHQLSFLLWAGATSIHLVARAIPAARLTTGSKRSAVPGGVGRLLTLTATMVVAALTAGAVLSLSGAWIRR
jgi:hypothetical protein